MRISYQIAISRKVLHTGDAPIRDNVQIWKPQIKIQNMI